MHKIEGKEIPVIIDKNSFVNMGRGQSLGLVGSDMILFAKVSDLPPEKAPGSFLNIDGKECIIDAWDVSFGMAKIALRQNRAM